jgi:tetratricopeptide (TPR) repeat protein
MDLQKQAMAKMKRRPALALSFLLYLLCSQPAAQVVPDAGLKAELAGNWRDAIEIYTEVLDANPRRLELWQRIADIQIRLQDPEAAAETLTKASRYAPDDPQLFFRLAQAHASADQKQQALAAINRAVELDPENVDYLRARAAHANWNADYATAQDSYERLLVIRPDDSDAMLGLAHSSTWKGDYDGAAEAFAAFVRLRPLDESDLWDYIQVQIERGKYAQAVKLGEEYRRRFGESLDYWLLMADLYALTGDNHASAKALARAAELAPQDAELHFDLAQSYASIDDPENALMAINRAVELEPNNLEYLRTRADLAAWKGDYDIAMDSNERIAALAPGDAGALLGVARITYWRGETDEALRLYAAYLEAHPHVHIAWAEYIQLETENGNYATAMELLDQYRERFGETATYSRLKARALAWAARPTPSLSIVSSLEPDFPDDYELNYTRTIALNNDHRPRAAVESLSTLIRLRPDSTDTADIQRYIRTPLRSYLNVFSGYKDDSDDISVIRAGAEGVYVLNPETRFWLAGDRLWLDAPRGSGFETVDGDEDINYTRVWLGASRLMSKRWLLYGTLGGGSIEDGDDEFVYEVGTDIWPRDEFSIRLFRRQDVYAISPRAVSLGIVRRNNQIDASWTPNLRWTIDSTLAYSTFSDDNERWDIGIAPRRVIVRKQNFNLDLGVSAYYFGFDRDPGNGYYAPSHYRRYSLTAFTYWKLSDDDGISLVFTVGPYKDNTMSGYETAFDIVGEGFFGIYRDWMLNIRGSFSQNGGLSTGAFEEWAVEAAITRRF